MKRQDFFKYFENKYPNDYISDYQAITLDIDLTNEDNKGTLCLLYLNSSFDDVFVKMGTDSFKIPKDIVNLEFDWDYAEENPDDDIWRYTARISLNQLYDTVVQNHQLYGESTILYRIEDTNDKGLYDGKGWSAMEKSTGFHPGPQEDPLFANIFDIRNYYLQNDYKREWNFAFADMNQLKSWLGDTETLNTLIQSDFVLKKITVASNCVISGSHQAVYKKYGVSQEESLNLSSVLEYFEPLSKLGTKKMPSVR